MTVYTRTDEGQAAAYDPQSALPRKLKSLLKLIDGKTSLAVLEEGLRAFGDVRGLVQSLNSAGLIEPMTDAIKAERSRPDQVGNTRMNSRATETSPGSRSTFAPSQMSTRFASNAVSEVKRSQALRQAEDSMANFVLTHLPEQSFAILQELEALTSLEQLAATLGGYEQVVSQVGPASQDHLTQIKQILREHL
jgi:hypothetical protein